MMRSVPVCLQKRAPKGYTDVLGNSVRERLNRMIRDLIFKQYGSASDYHVFRYGGGDEGPAPVDV